MQNDLLSGSRRNALFLAVFYFKELISLSHLFYLKNNIYKLILLSHLFYLKDNIYIQVCAYILTVKHENSGRN